MRIRRSQRLTALHRLSLRLHRNRFPEIHLVPIREVVAKRIPAGSATPALPLSSSPAAVAKKMERVTRRSLFSPVCMSTTTRSPSGSLSWISTMPPPQSGPPWKKGREEATTLTCTSTSVSRNSDTCWSPWQGPPVPNTSLSEYKKAPPNTLTSPRMVYTPKPSNNQTAKAIKPITTTAATIRSPRRPDKSPLEPEMLVTRSPLVACAHFASNKNTRVSVFHGMSLVGSQLAISIESESNVVARTYYHPSAQCHYKPRPRQRYVRDETKNQNSCERVKTRREESRSPKSSDEKLRMRQPVIIVWPESFDKELFWLDEIGQNDEKCDTYKQQRSKQFQTCNYGVKFHINSFADRVCVGFFGGADARQGREAFNPRGLVQRLLRTSEPHPLKPVVLRA